MEKASQHIVIINSLSLTEHHLSYDIFHWGEVIAEVRDCSCFVRLLIWRTCAGMRCGSTSALDPSVHGQMLGELANQSGSRTIITAILIKVSHGDPLIFWQG